MGNQQWTVFETLIKSIWVAQIQMQSLGMTLYYAVTQQTAQSQQVSQKHHLQIPAERICKAIIPYPKHPAKISSHKHTQQL